MTRTPDPRIRNPLLYPAELRAQIWAYAISLRTRPKIQFYRRGIAKLSVASSNFIDGKDVDLDLIRPRFRHRWCGCDPRWLAFIDSNANRSYEIGDTRDMGDEHADSQSNSAGRCSDRARRVGQPLAAAFTRAWQN